MRNEPLSRIDGPVLIFDRSKDGSASFFCSLCHTDFQTEDPARAFQLFAQHQPNCPSPPKSPSAVAS